MVKIWYLENEGLPYLIGEFKDKYRANFEIEKFKKRMTNPEAQLWWIYDVETEKYTLA